MPSPEYFFIKIDYSQLELRIIAEIAEIKGMIEEYRKGFDADLHWRTAAPIAGLSVDNPPKDIDLFKKYRKEYGKPTNFGMGYGQQAAGFKTNLRKNKIDFSLEKCQHMIDTYFKIYPEHKEYQKRIQKLAIRAWLEGQEYVSLETMFGRKRWFNIVEKAANNQIGVDRKGNYFAYVNDMINFPVQGTAADIVKRSMVHAEARLQELAYDATILLQVHDELVLRCHKRHLAKVVKLVGQESMIDINQPFFKHVPLITDASVGASWGNAEEVDHFIGVLAA